VIAVFEEGLVVMDWWEAFEGSEGLDGFRRVDFFGGTGRVVRSHLWNDGGAQ
jgi:hypothetical protein